MIDWNNIGDEEMRACVVKSLARDRDVMTFQAEREERSLKDGTVKPGDRREAAAVAHYSRKQAAHYQQAIDLLTAAPMPERGER